MPANPNESLGALPLRAAARAASLLVNPRGRSSERRLRDAVSGKVVLVTGASHGIGKAAAQKIGAAGATVLLVARSQDRLEHVRAQIGELDGRAHVYPTDLTDPESVDALVATVLEEHGHVDVIVNNAGKSIRRSIELSYNRFHDFQRTIDINYLGPVRLILALLPGMRKRGQGHIVNVSTIGVRLPPAPRWAAYQASKSAFDVWLRSVAAESRGDGVTATSIYMALVHTRMSAPTPVFRYVPGMRASEAADLVCHAIVERPRTIAPWWVTGVELAADVARGPLERGMTLLYRLTPDTASAAGRRGRRPSIPGVGALARAVGLTERKR
jgi:NAD(P)-dependent dehydrogenase (short-subunit alcohol dehydrogenase family)